MARHLDGAKLDEYSPIFVLRRAFVEDDRQMDAYRVLAFTIKAWNTWLAGGKMKIVHWRNTGPKAEGFPKFDVDSPKPPNSVKRSRERTEQSIRLITERRRNNGHGKAAS